jgi:hypothetical protein
MRPSQERLSFHVSPRQARGLSINYRRANFDNALEVGNPSARTRLALSNGAQDDKAPYLDRV